MIFERIEEEHLQFYMPREWRPAYLEFLRERRKRNERKKRQQQNEEEKEGFSTATEK